MAKFEGVDKARRLLGLGERATLKEVEQAYRRKVFQHHPDRGGTGSHDEEIMKDMNQAYKLLIDYCANFSYSFSEKDVAKTYLYDKYLRTYYYGWFDGI
ncbi:MAG: J domain-containing protein [Chloroflexota bacterium]|nr:J domain-containing protein [Chloroflexota bacterium]